MVKIEVQVVELEKEKMIMTTHYGDGELGDVKFDASFTLPTMSLIVEVGDKRYMVTQQDVIEQIIRLHESGK